MVFKAKLKGVGVHGSATHPREDDEDDEWAPVVLPRTGVEFPELLGRNFSQGDCDFSAVPPVAPRKCQRGP